VQETLEDWFPQISIIKSDQAHKVPPHLQVHDLHVDENDMEKLAELINPDQ
jgi:hypothetical protein